MRRPTKGCFASTLISQAAFTSIWRATIASAAEQFARYGVLPKDDFPGDGRLTALSFELDLPAMLENMLGLGFSDPERNLREWLVMFQHCSHRLAEELVKRQGYEGPPPSALKKG